MALAADAVVPERSFEHHVLDFLAYLEFERGLSRNTLEAYRSDLLQFGSYLARAEVDVLRAEHGELAGFLTELAAGSPERPPVAPATLQRKAACLRSFYRHLRREGILDRDPTADLRAPRKSQKLPQVLSRPEVARLLEAPRGTDPAALRDRALLELMYACGLRATEAIDLEVGDVDLDAAVLRALGVGDVARGGGVGGAGGRAPRSARAPSGRGAGAAGRPYARRGPPALGGAAAGPHLFVNRRGSGLTRQGLYKIVQRHAKAAGL